MTGPAINVGDWYLDRDQHDFLCVVDIDEEEGIVDIKDEYGNYDEIDFEEWATKDLVLCSAPRVVNDKWDEDDDELEEFRE